MLSEDKYRKAVEEYGHSFRVGMGAETIREMLKKIDLVEHLPYGRSYFF